MTEYFMIFLPLFVHILVAGGLAEILRGRCSATAQIALTCAVMLPFYIVRYRRERRRKRKRMAVWHLPLWALAGAAANELLSKVVGLFYTPSASEIERQMVLHASGMPAKIAVLVLLGPLTEEMLFRGLLLPSCKRIFPRWGSAVLVSFFFAVYHANLAQAIYAFPMGLLLCAAFETEDSILAPFFVHMGSNLLTVLTMGGKGLPH